MKKPQISDLPIYESMPQASGHTGIPIREFKEAKAAGCPAFLPGNRIALGTFLEWRFKQPPKDTGEVLALHEEKAMTERQRRHDMEVAAKVRDGELCEWDWIEREITEKFILPLTAAFNDAPSSLAVRCNPDNPELARQTIQSWCDGVKRTLREQLVPKEPAK